MISEIHLFSPIHKAIYNNATDVDMPAWERTLEKFSKIGGAILVGVGLIILGKNMLKHGKISQGGEINLSGTTPIPAPVPPAPVIPNPTPVPQPPLPTV